ncbi:uncharacterized protein LOC141654903 [Silene latifolia]|uniref:uncharacterized protein LOC141654903 n=1 Tax=Silene latifolia TaxID=37657 RepID=UPI003D76E786
MADSNTNEFDERVCHVSFHIVNYSGWEVPSSLLKLKQLKSFLLPLPSNNSAFFDIRRLFQLNDTSIFRIQSLRALRMHGLRINKLPRSIGKLIHLRYLDFSSNLIRKLPESITQLVNLYLLNLSYCRSLEELPEDINKLVMLRHLHLGGLTIVLVERSKDIVSEAKAANLDRKEITWFTMIFRESNLEDEMVLENLKPSGNLNNLRIENYGGRRLPCWMREGIHLWLPNLRLDKVEYIEENGSSNKSDMIGDIVFGHGVDHFIGPSVSTTYFFFTICHFPLNKTKDVIEQTCGPSNVPAKQRQSVVFLNSYLSWLRQL